MYREGFLCIVILGLAVALPSDITYDSVGTETKEVTSKTNPTGSLVSILDKSKRGAAKITNTDSPSFNHLSSNNLGSGTSSGSTTGFKPLPSITSNSSPLRYFYSNQYFQNPYVTYVQMPHPATQIAAQYAFQQSPVAHFFQNPTQIQYVPNPTVTQVPSVKYSTVSGSYSGGSSPSEVAAAGASTSSVYASPSQQLSNTASQVSSTASSTTTSVNKEVYSGHQASQPFYYAQQPFLYFIQPQVSPSNIIYQQPNANYLLKQQQYVNLFGGNRLNLYPTHNSQLTYLVPMTVQPSAQQSTATTDLKTSDKATTNAQYSSSSTNSFSYGTKV